MLFLMVSLFAFAASASSPPVADQTSDALLVTRFLDAVQNGTDEQALSMLGPNASLREYARTEHRSIEDFATYAKDCQLNWIKLTNARDGRRMPVSVEWLCRYPEPDRSASFWFEGDRISRIAWGDRPTIKIRPVDKQR